MALGGILNILIDPLFIFLFKMEIGGAALATMLSNVVAMVYFFGFLFRIRKTTAITTTPRYFTLRQGVPAEVLSGGAFPAASLKSCKAQTCKRKKSLRRRGGKF